MIHGDTVQDTRQMFFDSWYKYKQQQPLSPLETQLVEVIRHHPEYHRMLDTHDSNTQYHATLGEPNPFLHMGLHLTLRDQIATNRPAGMQAIFNHLLIHHGDKHQAEHALIEPLAHCLWTAQQQRTMPDEQAYLIACQALIPL